MSYVLVNRPVVVLEIDDIVESYIDINRRLAFDFLDRLEQAKKLILNFPFAFQIKYKNVRTIGLMQFPYQIHYIVIEDTMQIVILGVIHSSRNPKNLM